MSSGRPNGSKASGKVRATKLSQCTQKPLWVEYMDLDDAIRSHSSWKIRLSKYLRNPDGTLGPGEIGRDDRCELGRWLYGEGKKYALLPEYRTLVGEHARFHRAAANVVRKADQGHDTSKETALGQKSEFATASLNVVAAIAALKKKTAVAKRA